VVGQLDRVVVCLPRGRPVLLADARRCNREGDAALLKPAPQKGDRLRGALLRRQIDVNDRIAAVFFEQVLIDQVDVCDLERAFLEVGVILNRKAAPRDKLRDGGSLVDSFDRQRDGKIGPVHKCSVLCCKIIGEIPLFCYYTMFSAFSQGKKPPAKLWNKNENYSSYLHIYPI
jgi:hypothetical protein